MEQNVDIHLTVLIGVYYFKYFIEVWQNVQIDTIAWSIFVQDITKKCMCIAYMAVMSKMTSSLQFDRQEGCPCANGVAAHRSTHSTALCWQSFFFNSTWTYQDRQTKKKIIFPGTNFHGTKYLSLEKWRTGPLFWPCAGAPRVPAPRASLHVGLDPLGSPGCTASERPPSSGVLRGGPQSSLYRW